LSRYHPAVVADLARELSNLRDQIRYLQRMRRSVDGPLTERLAVARRALERGGWWRQPMRLPQRGDRRPSSQIDIGERVFIGKHSWINLTSPDATLVLGHDLAIGNSFTVGVGAHVEVGNGVMMSDRVTLLDQLHDFRSWVAAAVAADREPIADWGLTEPSPVKVGAGTWLGIGVVVLPGVTIGKGCAVGANAVVTRDLPDYAVAVGIPARVIGSALDEARDETVTQL